MDVEVTSFSKRHQRLFDAAATIHVITSEDLRRTGYEISTCTVQVTTGVQNLFHRRHTAFGTSNGGQVATQIECRIYGGVTWRS